MNFAKSAVKDRLYPMRYPVIPNAIVKRLSSPFSSVLLVSVLRPGYPNVGTSSTQSSRQSIGFSPSFASERLILEKI